MVKSYNFPLQFSVTEKHPSPSIALPSKSLIALTNKIFKSYIKLENFLIKAAKGDEFHAGYDDVLSIYYKDFDDNRFQVQLETLSEYCKEFDIISVRPIGEVEVL